jgi:hypothetical protein
MKATNKNKKKVGLRMDLKVIDMIDYISDKKNMKKIEVIENAIKEYIKNTGGA